MSRRVSVTQPVWVRGVRVGEASHPGPPGRDVIPRIHSDGAIQVDEESDVVGVSHIPFRRCTNPGGPGEGSRATTMPR